MMLAFKRYVPVLLAVAVAGCGSESQGPGAQVIKSVGALFQSGPEGPPPGPDDLLTRDVIDEVTVPYAMIGIERRGAYASMTLAGQNQGYESWVTSDGAGISLRDGLVTGTAGLGEDLVAADLGTLSALIRQGSGQTTRTHRYLNGEGRAFTMTLDCTVTSAGDESLTIIGKTYATRVVVETCAADQGTFENRYWIGKTDGVMWKSRQWVSNGVGPVIVLPLIPVAR